MKKKITTLLMAGLCALFAMAAGRVAPTLPAFVPLESGKTYCLYNVGGQMFWARSGSYAALNADPLQITLTQGEDGAYSVYCVDTQTYFGYSGSSMYIYHSIATLVNIVAGEDMAYTMQLLPTNSGYKADRYIGWNTGTDMGIYNNCTTDANITWKLVDGEAGETYYAKTVLFEKLEGIVDGTNGISLAEFDAVLTSATATSEEVKAATTELEARVAARAKLKEGLDAMKDSGYDIAAQQAVYDNPNSTALEIDQAASGLLAASKISGYAQPTWTEYPLEFRSSEDASSTKQWRLNGNSKGELFTSLKAGEMSTLTTFVDVKDDATLRFHLQGGANSPSQKNSLTLYIDGVEYKEYYDYQFYRDGKNNNYDKNIYCELTPGKHTIQWVVNASGDCSYFISEIGVKDTPLISVNLAEAGSLGHEVLGALTQMYGADKAKLTLVRKLKISGKMNATDWNYINTQMKDSLFTLDLTDTDVTDLQAFGTSFPCLHEIKLPKGLKSIPHWAFSGMSISEMTLPSSLGSIGIAAFEGTIIEEMVIPENCNFVTNYTDYRTYFKNCRILKKVVLPNKMTTIFNEMFRNCCSLEDINMPEGLTKVDGGAFLYCSALTIKELPEGLTSIGTNAFYGTKNIGSKTELILPSKVTYVGNYAFNGHTYDYIEFPVSYVNIGNDLHLPTSAKTVRFNCPTIVKNDGRNVSNLAKDDITIEVPNFLVNSYKLHDKWYEYSNIKGFDPSEVKDWHLADDLVLDSYSRMTGTPNITFATTGSLKVNGTTGMPLNNVTFSVDPKNTAYSRMFSNADGVSINGELTMNFTVGTANSWYFLSLPFDVKVSDIQQISGAEAKRAIRYYDGANRAANGASGSWKNFDAEAVITAGTGFIFQASQTGVWKFTAIDNENKQNIMSAQMFTKTLEAHPSENAADRGWNLVGNPYQSWFNNHRINFTAPFTVRNGNNYSAYSIIDDDYAIAPNQAFFVQCPDGLDEISFDLSGRQMTNVIESQTGSNKMDFDGAAAPVSRRLVDLTVSNGSNSDRTRVVLNDAATAAYDLSRDADKFMTDAIDVPQIYSFDEAGSKYAINERPEADGTVKLGFATGEGGAFTFTLTRNDVGNVWLTDNETGVTIDLNAQDYCFTSAAGTYDGRFTLMMTGEATGIGSAEAGKAFSVAPGNGGITVCGATGQVKVYTTGGVQAAAFTADGGEDFVALQAGIYVVKANGATIKVVVL